jgi:protease I
LAIIGVLIDDMFEDVEYTSPVKAFEKTGHQIIHIGLKEGKTVRGKKTGTPVKIDKAVKNVSVNDIDALLIPGGCSPDHLRGYKEPVNFVKDYFQSGKPLFAICHAPQILITAQLLEGRRITGWRSIIQDIKNAGAEFVNQSVVEDDNIISSRGPRDIPLFTNACLERLELL